MNNKLIFSRIERENIFQKDFINFKENNEIEFKAIRENNIAVLYGPNGTGKTSLAKILSNNKNKNGFDKKSFFSVKYDKKEEYNQDNNDLFHVINDQISRNIVPGTTEDYLLGDNIKLEYKLKSYIDSEFETLFKTFFPSKLKEEDSFNIPKTNIELINLIKDEKLKGYVDDLANIKSKGKKIDREDFLEKIENLKEQQVLSEDDNIEIKYKFIIRNYVDTNSIIYKLMNIDNKNIIQNESITQIEENDVAIKILTKYHDRENCIVCDNEKINTQELIVRKTLNITNIVGKLDSNTKKILDEIINVLELRPVDPFNIKNILVESIKRGDNTFLIELQSEIEIYFEIFNIRINNLFSACLKNSALIEKYNEYKKLLKEQPEITEEEMLFIEKIVSENIEKKIEIRRDEKNGNNFKLLLDGEDFLGIHRDKLHLSTGEQNFISLAFELLMAKKSENKIIVLDDPISSFDSIYKNKIVFCIVKFLEGKRQLILTHNTDLIKLLESQLQGCFNLYLLGNTDNGVNGFIAVNNQEKNILLDLSKLLDLFRNNIFEQFVDEKRYLIAMIPFMRGYSNVVGYSDDYKKLSKLMHGYEDQKVNLTQIYNNLFSPIEKKIENDYLISATDILAEGDGNIKILNIDNYPLLNHTLHHSFMYLFLRLEVERTLVNLFDIKIKINDFMLLHNIIMKAFKSDPTDSEEQKIKKNRDRIFFTSRKTLLNEFNHFEGNMNIFQPAIDISDTALEKEKISILNYLKMLRIEKPHK